MHEISLGNPINTRGLVSHIKLGVGTQVMLRMNIKVKKTGPFSKL